MLKIKGLNDSLVIVFDKGSFDDYYSVLEKKLMQISNCLAGLG